MSDLINLQNFELLTKSQIQELISNIENRMNENVDLKIEIQPKHYFSKKVYAREIEIKKGTFLVGKIHKYNNLNILSKGDITIFSIEGSMRVQAPYTVVSIPGVKRFAYAHEDCIWTTIHGTDETDLDKIENEFIANDYSEVFEEDNKLESKEKLWLG